MDIRVLFLQSVRLQVTLTYHNTKYKISLIHSMLNRHKYCVRCTCMYNS